MADKIGNDEYGEILIYQTDDGQTNIEVKIEDEKEQKDGRILKGLRFKFPIYMNGRNVLGLDWDNESTDESVVGLHRNDI